jgi:hypothetical protein
VALCLALSVLTKFITLLIIPRLSADALAHHPSRERALAE